MAAVNQVGNTLTGLTGSGSFVGSIAPTFTGTVTAATLAFSNYATGGILGTTTNDSAAATYVGEFISSSVNAVAITSTITTNITSITLTAGDWDVWGDLLSAPAAGTTTVNMLGGVNITSATFAANQYFALPAAAATVALGGTCPPIRLSLSAASTTVYLIAYIAYGVSTLTMGGNLYARRRR